MKFFVFVALLGFVSVGFAQDLETDDSFFKSSTVPYEDDDLDRITKKDQLRSVVEQQKNNENKVQKEFSSTTTGLMSAEEARRMDQKIIAENKRRQKAILQRLAQSSGLVQECVSKNLVPGQPFNGGQATVIWMVAPSGKVLDSAVKATTIENDEIQKCIHRVAAGLDFNEARSEMLRKSLVEYTYKFKKKVRPVAGKVRKVQRKTASQ